MGECIQQLKPLLLFMTTSLAAPTVWAEWGLARVVVTPGGRGLALNHLIVVQEQKYPTGSPSGTAAFASLSFVRDPTLATGPSTWETNKLREWTL